MAVIPFVFIWKGEAIRSRSAFCQYLIQKEVEDEAKRKRREERSRKRSRKESGQDNASPALNGVMKDESMV